ncbi:holo-ACP synthase [Candidatus Micrarchaeota archaeon]|nr:holo-ACP synthase [Candidatus Micrarchaeota archaeon]
MSATILAIGVDIELVERFAKKLGDKVFLKKIFTRNELKYCLKKITPEHHLAVRYAAKEAVFKALYTALKSNPRITLKDIEVLINFGGFPSIYIKKIKKEQFKKMQVHISLSHSDSNAIAFAVIERP